MSVRRWSWIAGWLTLSGGVAWLAKIAVIVATDGRVMTTGAAAWLMRLGLVGLFVGVTGVGLWLARRAGWVARVAAVLVSPVALAVSIWGVGSLATSAFGMREPAYMRGEIGIVAAAVLGLAIGAWQLRHVQRAPHEAPRPLRRA